MFSELQFRGLSPFDVMETVVYPMERSTMSQKPWATFVWPGLPQVWLAGSWAGLAVAAGFAVLLNLALVSSLVWSELLTEQIRSILWLAVVVYWAAATGFAYRWSGPGREKERPKSADDRLPLVQEQYLRGNWFETERMLADLLRSDPHDAEARLLLATLLRHTGRLDEAAGQLRELGKLEAAGRLAMEISRERQALAEARQDDGADETQEAAEEDPDLQHAA